MSDLREWAASNGFGADRKEAATEDRASAIKLDAEQRDQSINDGSSSLRSWAAQNGFGSTDAPKPSDASSVTVSAAPESKGFLSTVGDAIDPRKMVGRTLSNLATGTLFAKDFATGVSDMPTQVKAATAAAIEGDDVNELVKKDWKDQAIDDAKSSSKSKSLSKDAGGDNEYFLGITRNNVRNLSQNGAFSVVSMGAGLVAGATASAAAGATVVGAPAAPAAGYAAGAAASGLAAYRMDTNSFLRDMRQQFDNASVKTRGTPLTDNEFIQFAEKYNDLVKEHGYWEAIPEALGTVLTMGTGKIIFKEAAMGLKGVIKSSTAAAIDFGGEIGTETITQTGQHNVEVKAGMSDEPKRSFTSFDDLAKSAKEVLPDVLLLSGTTMGASHASGVMYDKLYNTPTRQLAQEIERSVKGTEFTQSGIHQDVMDSMNPNRDTQISPLETSRTQQSVIPGVNAGAGVAPPEPPEDQKVTDLATNVAGTETAVGASKTVADEAADAEHSAGQTAGQKLLKHLQDTKAALDGTLDKLMGRTDTQQQETSVGNTSNNEVGATIPTSENSVAHEMSLPNSATNIAGDVNTDLSSQLSSIDKQAEDAARLTPVSITDAQGNQLHGFETANGELVVTNEDGTEYRMPKSMAAKVEPLTPQSHVETNQSPVVKSAVEQINKGFGLENGESVVINEVKGDKRLDAFAKAIKQAFGVDIGWVDFGKNGEMKTNKGRSFNGGRYNGYRVAGQKAILLDTKSAKLLDTLGHELTHVLEEEHPEIYRTLVQIAKERVPETKQRALRKALDAAVSSETDGKQTAISEREYESELVAYVVGEQAGNSKFWGEVFSALDDKNLVQQLMDLINKIVDAIKSATKWNTSFIKDRGDILAVQKAATEAFQTWLKLQQTPASVTTATESVANETTAHPNTQNSGTTNLANTDVTSKQNRLTQIHDRIRELEKEAAELSKNGKPSDKSKAGKRLKEIQPEYNALHAERKGLKEEALNKLRKDKGIWKQSPFASRIQAVIDGYREIGNDAFANVIENSTQVPTDSSTKFQEDRLNTERAKINAGGKVNFVPATMQTFVGQFGYGMEALPKELVQKALDLFNQRASDLADRGYSLNDHSHISYELKDEIGEIKRIGLDLASIAGDRYAVNKQYAKANNDRLERMTADYAKDFGINPADYPGIDITEHINHYGYKRGDKDSAHSANENSTPFSREIPEKETAFQKLQFKFAGDIYTNALESDPQWFIDDYIKRNGINVNPDLAREFSPFYTSDPARFAPAVHTPSSHLAQLVYNYAISNAQPTDKVVFLAGGGGSGKGFIGKRIDIFNKVEEGQNDEVAKDGVIVYDGVMGKYPSASARINQALGANLDIEMFYVNTPALKAFKNALQRAITKNRTVPIRVLAEAHTGASDTIRQINDEFGSRIKLNIVSSKDGQVVYSDISSVPVYNTNELVKQFQTELDRQVKEDDYPERLAEAFRNASFSRELRELDEESLGAEATSNNAGRGQSNVPVRGQEGATGSSTRRADVQQSGQSNAQGVQRKDEAGQTHQVNPLKDYVSPADAEGRIRRREIRKDGTGSPTNERTVIGAGNKQFVAGKVTHQDWLNRVNNNLSKEEIQDSRTWYSQLHDALAPIFGDDAPRYALAWLMSQQRASPTKGMQDVLRAIDLAAGKVEIKKAGLNQKALIATIKGELPEAGLGAKLLDFIDSEMGNETRTVVRGDVRGRQPAAIDVWAQRDIGFVDPTVHEYIRKTYGQEAADRVIADKTVNGESQYEYGIDFYNDVVDFLNKKKFEGGGWTAREVQAVGWVTMQKAMGIKAEFVRDIIGGNTRRVSIGLAAGDGSFMKDKANGKEIPKEVAQKVIGELADLAGLNILQNVNGVGAYLQSIEGSIQIDAFSSPEAVRDFMDMVGYAFQQTEIISTRPLKSGSRMAYDILSKSLNSSEVSVEFFNELLNSMPTATRFKNDYNTEGKIAAGFQQVTIDGVPGIRLLNLSGKWNQKEIDGLNATVDAVAEKLGIDGHNTFDHNVEIESTSNNWEENKHGEAYTTSLSDRGRLQEVRELQRRYPPQDFGKRESGINFSREIGSNEGSSGRSGDLSESGSSEVPVYGQKTEGSVSAIAHHFSTQVRTELDGKYNGNGIKGAEQSRLAQSTDPRIKERIYFYVDAGHGVRPEHGIGSHQHTVNLQNLYDVAENKSIQKTLDPQMDTNDWMNSFESSVIDSGYDGYVAPFGNQKAAVLLGRHNVSTGKQTRGMFSRELLQDMSDNKKGAPDGLVLGMTPPVLKALGMKDLPLAITREKIIKITRPNEVGKNTKDLEISGRVLAKRIPLSVKDLYDLPALIADPVAVLKSSESSSTGGKGFVIILNRLIDGYPLIVAISDNQKIKMQVGSNQPETQITEISTAHPKNQTFVKDGKETSSLNKDIAQNTLYFNKKYGSQLLQGHRLYLPRLRTGPDSTNILTPEKLVNKFGDNAFKIQRASLAIAELVKPRQYTPQPDISNKFSRDLPIADDLAEQTSYLDKLAHDAGFSNLDDWGTKEPEQFMKAAEEWRDGHKADTLFNRDLTNTTEFKKWFDDSKVVDKDDNPIVMYHGTYGDVFTVFNKEKIRPQDYDIPLNGFWFSSDKSTSPAMQDAKNTIPVYLSIKNPAPSEVWKKTAREVSKEFYENRESALRKDSRSIDDEVRYRLQDEGYDGIQYSGEPNINKEEFEKTGQTSFKDFSGKWYTLAKNNEDGGVDLYDGKLKSKPNTETDEYITGYLDLNDYLKTEKTQTWLVFEPNQIKSATGNTGYFSKENSDIRFSRNLEPKVGEEFTVLRYGSKYETDLNNKNAASPKALLDTIDDGDLGAIPSTRLSPSQAYIHAYHVTVNKPFGEYQVYNGSEKNSSTAVGMKGRYGGQWLSFPEGADFTSKLIGSIKASDLLAQTEKQVGPLWKSDHNKSVAAMTDVLANNGIDIRSPMGNFAREVKRPLKGARFELPARTKLEHVSNKLVDSMSRVTAVQRAVAKQGGLLTDKTNVSESLQRAYNRAGHQLDTFRRNLLDPIISDIAKEGLEMSDVANLMYAMHAEEANSYIAMINPSFPDGGSGMTDAESKAIIDKLKKSPKYPAMLRAARSLQALTKQTQNVLLESGLVDPDMIERWNATYDFFVPLRGFEQVDTDVETTKGGKSTGVGKFDVAQNFTKRRLGRASRATNLIENIVGDYERAVAASERNKVLQTFLAWITVPANKDDILWKVNRVILAPQYKKGVMQSPLGYVLGEVNYIQKVKDGGTTLPVRHNGKIYHIDILDKGTYEDLEMTSSKDSMLLHVASVIGKPMRMLSKLWTMYNPEFLFTNAQRDAEMALSSLGVEHGVKVTKDTFKRVPKMAWSIWRIERGSDAGAGKAISWNGKDLSYKDIYDMYRQDGGKTGTMDLKTIEDKQIELMNAIKQAQASYKNPKSYHHLAMRYLQNLEDFIGDMNGAIEQMYRVGSYAAILENGGTREQATKVAMNITVNFSRKGKWTPLLAPFYMFLNPSVQSVVKAKELLLSKKGAALAAGLVGLGVAIAAMNHGNGGDDGDDYWDLAMNQDAKLKNLIWFGPNGERYTVPLFYGLGFFVNMGYAIHDMARGRSISDSAKFMANSFATHFSPLGTLDNTATFLSPTLLDPVNVLSSGRKENGLPLMPDQPAYGAPKPNSERYWSATKDTAYQRFSAWLNELGGGTAATAGTFGPFGADVSPESLKYLATYVVGGAGAFISNLTETADLYFNVDKSAPMEKNTVPFVRKFYQTDTGKANQVQFYKNRDQAMTALAEWKLYETDPELRNRDDVTERVAKNQNIAILGDAVQKYNIALSDISKMEKMESSRDIDKSQRYDISKKYEQQRQDLYMMFNKEFFNSKP